MPLIKIRSRIALKQAKCKTQNPFTTFMHNKKYIKNISNWASDVDIAK